MQDANDQLSVDVLTATRCVLKYLLCFIEINQRLWDLELIFLVDLVLGSVAKEADLVHKGFFVEQQFVHVVVGKFDGLPQLLD